MNIERRMPFLPDAVPVAHQQHQRTEGMMMPVLFINPVISRLIVIQNGFTFPVSSYPGYRGKMPFNGCIFGLLMDRR